MLLYACLLLSISCMCDSSILLCVVVYYPFTICILLRCVKMYFPFYCWWAFEWLSLGLLCSDEHPNPSFRGFLLDNTSEWNCWVMMFSFDGFYVYFLHSTGDFDSWPRLSILSTQKEGWKRHYQSMDELIKDGILRWTTRIIQNRPTDNANSSCFNS